MVGHKGRFGLFLVFLISFLQIPPVFAEKFDFDIGGKGCEGLDIDEIARLVRIELSEAVESSGGLGNLSVHLECRDGEIEVLVFCAETDKTLKRSIEPRDQKAKHRVVALSISQLIAVARMEFEKKREDNEGKQTAQTKQAVERPSDPPKEVDRGGERGESGDRDLFLTGGAKLRSGTSLLVGDLGLRSDLLFTENLGVSFIAEFETGSTSRESGTVSTLAIFGGVGAVGRFFRNELFFLGASVEALMGYGRLIGSAKTWADGKSAGGITGQFAAAAAPTLVLKRVLLSINVKGGYTLANPVGFVEREKDVTLGGFWAGIDLCLGWRFESAGF